MKRAGAINVVAAIATCLLLPVGLADAGQHPRHKKRSGVVGVVRDATCYGPCAVPAEPDPVYSGSVTVSVQRASDGVQVASAAITDGHFRFRLKRGAYDVSSVPPAPPSCQPPMLCPAQASSAKTAVVAPCETGETQRVQVRRHRFTQVDLHVQNVCIV
jgi:hypothetical protein